MPARPARASSAADPARPSPEVVALRRPPSGITRTIRRRPVPHAPVQGTLALEWVLPGGAPAEPVTDHALRLVPRPGAVDDTDPAVAQVPTARADLPDPGPWTAQLVQAVLEVLGRERPRQQLVRWLSPEVYAELSAHVAAGPVRPASGAAAGRARRTVSSLHLCEPVDGVVEASAVVLGGARARAMAIRLEGWDGRWRCTRLALL
jgi:Family of unknown function (DUF6459)